MMFEIGEHTMEVDPTFIRELTNPHGYEPFETLVFSQIIKEGDIVLDIGAHIGFHTLNFARLVGQTGKVFAFEPAPNNFALLKQNVKGNGYKNVILEQKAVSNKTGKVNLFLCDTNTGDHRIYDSNDERPSVEVEAITLNDYFKGFKKLISFIKMDIQGAEMSALKGMSSLLRKNQSIAIAFEFWPHGLEINGVVPEHLLKRLQERGFTLSAFNNKSKMLNPLIDFTLLLGACTSDNKEFRNILATR